MQTRQSKLRKSILVHLAAQPERNVTALAASLGHVRQSVDRRAQSLKRDGLIAYVDGALTVTQAGRKEADMESSTAVLSDVTFNQSVELLRTLLQVPYDALGGERYGSAEAGELLSVVMNHLRERVARDSDPDRMSPMWVEGSSIRR